MIKPAEAFYVVYRDSANRLPYDKALPEWDALPAEERLHWLRVVEFALHLAAESIVTATTPKGT